MSEFQQFVIDCHQFFWGLVVLAFSIFWAQDLNEFREHYPQKTRGIFLVFGVFLFVSVFLLLLQVWKLPGIFFAFEFAFLVTLSLVHPKYAVSFLLFLLLSRPWETFNDQMMSSMPRDISILALLCIIAHKVFNKSYYFRFNGGTLWLLAFSCWMFLSGFFSHHVDLAMINYSEVFSKGVILFLMIQNSLEKDKDLLPVKAVFIVAILEKCFVSFWKTYGQEASSIVEDGVQRLESVGILSNSNDIAAIFVLAIPFTVIAIWKSGFRPFNYLLAPLALLLMSYMVWQSQSRGALLGVFAIFGAWMMIQIKSKKLLGLVVAGGLIATLGAFKLMNRDQGDIEGSTSNRILYWRAGLNMAIRNPVFGVGFWGFPHNLPAYVPDGNVGSEKEHMTAHSSWVLALGEGGPMALVLFGALWLYAMWRAWLIRFRNPEYFLAICGYGMAITFLSHTYLLYPYILLSLTITHSQITPQEELA